VVAGGAVEKAHAVFHRAALRIAGAISFARLRRLYFGASDPKGGAVESGVRFFDSATCHHRPEVYGGIGESECAALLTEFFRARR
jgi:tRNA(adenine34) deaminase